LLKKCPTTRWGSNGNVNGQGGCGGYGGDKGQSGLGCRGSSGGRGGRDSSGGDKGQVGSGGRGSSGGGGGRDSSGGDKGQGGSGGRGSSGGGGLKNYGNTCFLNVLLQSLRASPIFLQHFLKNPHNPNCREKKTNACLACLLQKFFTSGTIDHAHEIISKNLATLVDSSLSLGDQHDPHEVLYKIIGAVAVEDGFFSMFNSQQLSIVTCKPCQVRPKELFLRV
jgi:hypothetical protein